MRVYNVPHDAVFHLSLSYKAVNLPHFMSVSLLRPVGKDVRRDFVDLAADSQDHVNFCVFGGQT